MQLSSGACAGSTDFAQYLPEWQKRRNTTNVVFFRSCRVFVSDTAIRRYMNISRASAPARATCP